MPRETSVHLRLDSTSVFDALVRQVGQWQLSEHVFDPDVDEVRISYDSGGTGRVAVTVGFELDRAQMEEVLRAARPAP
jgi:hypothetical protein